jgi:hypothetical protein
MDSATERMKLNVVKGILIISIILSGQLKSCSGQELTGKTLKDLNDEDKQKEEALLAISVYQK